MDFGVLLGVPTESIAIRVVLASAGSVLLAHLVLRSGLRVPRVRAAAALTPALALAAIVIVAWNSLRAPLLMLPVEATRGLAIPVGGGYLNVAPLAVPVVIGCWFAIAALRVAVRCRREAATRRWADAALHCGDPLPPSVSRLLRRTAARMRTTPPPAALVEGCPGGATIVGVRRPVLLIDAELAGRLDRLELEGVLAHELAHLRRRDNLQASVVGFVRDLAFFVPGGRWASRRLHAERELAADQLAVETTRRPGALASGLLKVIEAARPASGACAALMPRGTLVERVQHLVDDRPEPGRLRVTLETGTVVAVVGFAVAAALAVPNAVAGDGTRDALALLLGPRPAAADEHAASPRAFQVYRESVVSVQDRPSAASPLLDDDLLEIRASTLAACRSDSLACPEREHRATLGLRPRMDPRARGDAELVDRWRARPLVPPQEGIGVYWLSRSVE